jgi:anti-anti-sigma factor
LQLSLETRLVGRVTIVRCTGRIVAGSESESLRDHITWLLHDRRAIVLHLGDVGFIDSSGLGSMVRVLNMTRRANAELKLCNVPEHIHKVLKTANLTMVFESHESEEIAIAAFRGSGATAAAPALAGRKVLCLDHSDDLLAYLRELLHRAGYDVQTFTRVADAMVLMRVKRPDLLLLGPDVKGSPDRLEAFRAACAGFPVIALDREFTTRDAGEAGAGLLEEIKARLSPNTV